MPDELLRIIMQYAGLKATTALSLTCTAVKNLVNYEAIGMAAMCHFITNTYYQKYPDDDEVVEIARHMDVIWSRVVQLRGDKEFCRWALLWYRFRGDHRHTMDVIKQCYSKCLCTFSWSSGVPSWHREPGPLPLTRAKTYLVLCCDIVMAIENVLNHDVWTIPPDQKTRLRLLLENDLSITRPDTVIDTYLSKSEDASVVYAGGHTNVADLPA